MEDKPHMEPYAVAAGASDEPPEDAVGEERAVVTDEDEAAPPAEAAGPSPMTPGGEIGRRPMRSGAEAGAGAALAEAGSAASGPPGEGSFGAWLRRQREIREIDLREIADKTKISLRYLKAMEQDRFEVLPAPIFARGFLREYARYVGLDADEVVNYYLAAHHPAGDDDGEDTAAGAGRLPRGDGRGPLTRGALIGFVILLVLAALAYWWFYQRSQETADRPPPPIATPASALPLSTPPDENAATAGAGGASPAAAGQQAPAVAAATPLVVTLDFTEKCWLEVQVDGGRRLSKNYVAGESLQLEAERQVTLETVGNVGGVEVQVNGRPFELPTRGSDRTARGVVIDLESAAAPLDS